MNILDNLRPMDAGSALHASIRILKPGGKALIKLNPWLSPGKIKEWNIRTVEMDLRGDGSCIEIKKMFFCQELLHQIFSFVRYVDLFYEEYDKHERLFLCVK